MMHHTTAQNKDYKLCIYPAYREKEKKKVKCKTKQENDKEKGSLSFKARGTLIKETLYKSSSVKYHSIETCYGTTKYATSDRIYEACAHKS